MKRVALIISNNEWAEQLLPIFYKELIKNFETTIFCPLSVKDYIFQCYPANQYRFSNFSAADSFLTTLISDLRTHILIDYNLTPAINWYVKTRILKTGGFYTKFIFFLCSVLKKIKFLRNKIFWDEIEQILLKDKKLEREFASGGYRAVLFPNPVLHESEIKVFYAAKGAGMKTVSINEAFFEFSWKFHSFRPMDKIFCWSGESIKEAKEFHGIPAEKFEITGPVRFDLYYRPDLFPTRDEFLKHFNLSGNDKLITFTLNRYPINKTLAKIIHDAVAGGSLPRDVKLLIRFIPKDTRNANPEKIENLKKEFADIDKLGIIRFDIPQDSDFCRKNIPDNNIGRDIIHLGSLLKYSAAVVMVRSTVIVEARIFYTPSFCMGFVAENGRIKKADYAKFGYFQEILKHDNNSAIFTIEQLINKLNEALKIDKNNPNWQMKCDNFVRAFMTHNDGKTSERIVSSLKNYI